MGTPVHRTFTEQAQAQGDLLTCKVIDNPGSLHDPFCGLPYDPASMKYGEGPMCTDHLSDYIQSTL